MLPGEDLRPGGTEEQRHVSTDASQGSEPSNSTQETPPPPRRISGGNALPVDFINTQPLPAAAPAGTEASQDPVASRKPPPEIPPPYPGPGEPQASGRPVPSSRSTRSSGNTRNKEPASQQPPASAADSCLQLLLACLSCQGSVLLLGVLEACSSCLHALCSPCCHACGRCCSAVREAPVEELSCHAHCHRVLFGSCCEPIECLEFCLECCEICHRG